ncbi:MAG: glycine cleavage system aminomethyltransferase GcvT [Hyphomicrobiaceae bacterium]
MSTSAGPPSLKRTPLFAEHEARDAKMVPFAGYTMPVHYRLGILKEHLHTRAKAGLFDVSHMGQAVLAAADGTHETVARALETLVPADILSLASGRQRYTQLLDEGGGIIDDLMVTRPAVDGTLLLVVNASRKDIDYARIAERLPADVRLRPMPDRALLAVQGPMAAAILAPRCPQTARLEFMTATTAKIGEFECHVGRSGYTGEDGFEISVAAEHAARLWQVLLRDNHLTPIGLGARDTLRLEAGLCLYGHELDETTSPVEAGLVWSIQKRRREQGGFPGAARVQAELKEGPKRSRIGLMPEGRAPAREGTEIRSPEGDKIGVVTSGTFGPTVDRPVAMGYIEPRYSSPGTRVILVVRGKPLPATVTSLPFVPHRYARKI